MAPSLLLDLDPLGWRLAAGTLTCAAYRDALAGLLLRAFEGTTVALWRVTGAQGTRTLACLGQYRPGGDSGPCTGTLSETRLGTHFAVLDDRGVYACDDTLDDGHRDAAQIRHGRPDAPRAFLDALVAINGHAHGVLSCWQATAPRRWTVDEEATLRRLGARVALHLARFRPATTPDRPLVHSALTRVNRKR
jgi:GAF domain-containing protein